MKKCFVFDTWLTGHHSRYLNWILSVLHDLDCDCTLGVGENEDMSRLPLSNFSCITVEKVAYRTFGKINNKGLLKALLNDISWYIALRRFLFGKPAGTVVLPFFDSGYFSVSLLGIPKRFKLHVITMQSSFHHNVLLGAKQSNVDSVRSLAFTTLIRKKNIDTVFTIDPLMDQYISQNMTHIPEAKKVRYLPDPYGVNWEKNIIVPHKEKLQILLFGSITFRKGVKELLQLLQSDEFRRTCSITIAGMQSKAVTDYIDSEPLFTECENEGSLHIQNEFVSVHKEEELFRACDIVWVYYPDFSGMSGILIEAGYYAKPIISGAKGVVGWFSVNNTIGVTISIQDSIDAITQKIITLKNAEKYCECADTIFEVFKNYNEENAMMLLSDSIA